MTPGNAQRPVKIAASVLLCLIAAGVGLSRCYLRYHTLQEVVYGALGGCVGGVVYGVVVLLVVGAVSKGDSRRKQT